MRFAHDFTSPLTLAIAIGCVLVLVGYATVLLLQSFARGRALLRFGEPRLVERLHSFDSTVRRTVKGVLSVLALACAFAALARPQFGGGTRLVPATNLDVALVLDFSKSMYAADVVPNRITRAKAEIAKLVQMLPGARFGAVAFAGEPMSFPLTSDGAAIAQFFRQLEPNDMPVGGTATARALESARDLFARDPKAKDHMRVIVLVTDGEDLEGDPVAVAEQLGQERTRVDVVQIGGRAPEIIPDIGPDGKYRGRRVDDEGKSLMTSLSAEGEAQLAKIAQTTGGAIVRADKGATGIDVVARGLSKLMREELAERVETVYAEEYAWPLGAALLLLVLEALVAEAPRRGSRKADARRKAAAGRAAIATLVVLALGLGACGWDPKRPFDRDAPAVRSAIASLDAGDASSAAGALVDYLGTGPCSEGNIGTPPSVKALPNASFDLGLALFQIGEAFGRRFGDEEGDAGLAEQATAPARKGSIDCAHRVTGAVADDPAQPPDLRARARYLQGNLAFLDARYADAVKAYDQALVIAPGQSDAGDPVGRDAAWNRAIAMRRIDDKKDAGQDAGDDPDKGDAGKNDPDGGTSKDAGKDSGSGGDGGGGGGKDGGGDDAGGGGDDAGPPDAGPPPADAGSDPPPPRSSQDDRVLDRLEAAPTMQHEWAKRAAQRRQVRGMADK